MFSTIGKVVVSYIIIKVVAQLVHIAVAPVEDKFYSNRR